MPEVSSMAGTGHPKGHHFGMLHIFHQFSMIKGFLSQEVIQVDNSPAAWK